MWQAWLDAIGRALGAGRPAPLHGSSTEPAEACMVAMEQSGDLDTLFDRSNGEKKLVFNHDPYCPISRRAYREVAQVNADVALIDVARRPELARDLEWRTGVSHESPQVIVLRAGTAVWHASHYAVTTAALRRALAATDSEATSE